MSAVFAQEMHRPRRGPNVELILPPPLGRASIPRRWAGEARTMLPAQSISPGQTAVLAPGRLPQEGGFGEAERKEITELDTSLEQGFGFWFTIFHLSLTLESAQTRLSGQRAHRRKWGREARAILALGPVIPGIHGDGLTSLCTFRPMGRKERIEGPLAGSQT